MNIALIYCKLSSANSSKDWIRIWMEKRVECNRINGFFVIFFYCWYQNKSKIGMKILNFRHISSNTLSGGIIFDPVKLLKEIVSRDPIGIPDAFWSSRFIFEITSLKSNFSTMHFWGTSNTSFSMWIKSASSTNRDFKLFISNIKRLDQKRIRAAYGVTRNYLIQ